MKYEVCYARDETECYKCKNKIYVDDTMIQIEEGSRPEIYETYSLCSNCGSNKFVQDIINKIKHMD